MNSRDGERAWSARGIKKSGYLGLQISHLAREDWVTSGILTSHKTREGVDGEVS